VADDEELTDDEEVRRARAERLRRKIDEVLHGEDPPAPQTPREFTDAAAREAAEEARRERAEDGEDEDGDETAIEEEAEDEPEEAEEAEDDDSTTRLNG
jgi:hypothetical protein